MKIIGEKGQEHSLIPDMKRNIRILKSKGEYIIQEGYKISFLDRNSYIFLPIFLIIWLFNRSIFDDTIEWQHIFIFNDFEKAKEYAEKLSFEHEPDKVVWP